MDRFRAVKAAIKIAEEAIEAGVLADRGLSRNTANGVADFIEELADRLEKMNAPGDNY